MRLIDVDELGVGRCSKDVLPAAYCAGWNGLLGLIEKAPTVDAVPVVHGQWNADETCSLCGEKSTEGLDATKWDYWLPNYCPNCGAKMDGGNENV